MQGIQYSYIIYEVLCIHFVDLVKCSVLTIVGKIQSYGNDHYYYIFSHNLSALLS